nr:hypothetical protein L203_04043 [Cryptococcus depauperatus CBS 7841]
MTSSLRVPLVTGPFRESLPDTGHIYFTHGDFTLGNIMISDPPGPRWVVSIIDWEQSGWYPEYWEYCKLLYGVEYSHEWRSDKWAYRVVRPYEDVWESMPMGGWRAANLALVLYGKSINGD